MSMRPIGRHTAGTLAGPGWPRAARTLLPPTLPTRPARRKSPAAAATLTWLGAWLCLLFPGFVSAGVGPDLSQGTQTDYFTTLRMEYAKHPKTEFYPAWKLAPEHTALLAAYKAGDVDKVIQLADAWLKKCPIDADTHLRVAMCFKEKGNLPDYTYHLGVFYGLLKSIVSGGDGLTPKTAFKVVSVQEEYSLIQEIGGSVKSQTLEGSCDKMEITRNKGATALTLYFDVTIPLNALAAEMKNADAPKEKGK